MKRNESFNMPLWKKQSSGIFNTLALLFIAAAFTSCSVQPLSSDKLNNFSTQGFLDDHRFQVIISAKADPSAKGLVAQRDSALIRARNELQKKTVAALAAHRIELYNQTNASSPLSAEESERMTSELATQFFPLLAYGRVAEEYYEKDNTALIVFRIEKNNLRKEIESAGLSLAPKKP